MFCLLGIGTAPWQLASGLGLPARACLSFLAGWGALTSVPMVMGAVDFWHPAAVFLVLAAVAVDLHGIGIAMALRDLRPRRTTGGVPTAAAVELTHDHVADAALWARDHAGVLLSIAGAAICIVQAVSRTSTTPGFWGFLPTIGVLWFIGLALVLAGLVLARPTGEEWHIAVPVLLLVLVLTLTPSVVYDGPRSQAAAKHVDLVNQVRAFHQPRSSVAIYNGWDGYFAAVAWICDITGIPVPMDRRPSGHRSWRASGWWRCAGCSEPSSFAYPWTAVALAVLSDPIGADYFSPQSVGFVL